MESKLTGRSRFDASMEPGVFVTCEKVNRMSMDEVERRFGSQ
jgi:hypothetical protein